MTQLFRPVDPSVSFPELETGILDFWRDHDIFRRSIEERPEDNLFVFYEGPPTANGRPGVHHIMPRVIKDLFARYKTMRGYRVPRKAGWDTHGLPVEIEVEKELGLNSKPEIEAYGIDKFNAKCRESVNRYVGDFEALTERIAFWADMDNPYVTYDNDYIESGWWIFKQLWDHGLVYQDYRSTPHCPRCETSLSDHELSQGYRDDVSDPSVYIKFRLPAESRDRIGLADGPPASIVAWTTTPWTLPGNTALAVKEDAAYGLYEDKGEHLILAEALAESVLGRGARGGSHLRGLGTRWARLRTPLPPRGARRHRPPLRQPTATCGHLRTARTPTACVACSPPTTSRSTTARASCTSPPPSVARTSRMASCTASSSPSPSIRTGRWQRVCPVAASSPKTRTAKSSATLRSAV